MLVNVFWSYATTANGKEMYKSDMHVQKKPACFAINPNLFLFSALVAVGRCLVFVEPTSAFRLNKISHLKNLSSVDSDCSEWNFIAGFVPNMQQNFQDEVENYDPTTRGFGGAEDEDVAIRWRAFGESAVYSRVQQEEIDRRGVKAEATTNWEEVRTMP